MWNRMHSDHSVHSLPDFHLLLLSRHEPGTRFSAGESSFHCSGYYYSYCSCYDLTTVNRDAVGTDGDDGDVGLDDDQENWSKAHTDDGELSVVVPDADAAGEKTSDSLEADRL